MKKQYIKPEVVELKVEVQSFVTASQIPVPPDTEDMEEDADNAAAKPLPSGYDIWDDSGF